MRKLAILAAMVSAFSGGCASMNNTQRGATAGAAVGALAGGAIGSDHGRAGAGAVIGAAAGSMIGAVAGAGADEDERRMREAEAAALRPVNGPLRLEDIVDMARRGIGDDVIRNQIRTSGTRYNLAPTQIAWLHDNGVSDAIISEMQNTAYRGHRGPRGYEPVYVVPAPPPPPVVIRPTIGVGLGWYKMR